MTFSTHREVKPLDFGDRGHRALLFDLALANKRHLLNDHDSDILLIISYYENHPNLHPFVALVDGEEAGCFWVEVDGYSLGRIRGALLPGFKNAWNANHFMRWLVRYGFESLGLRKLDCELSLYNKRDRESASAERLLKRIGFKKRAILPESLMIDGQPRDTILLDYLKRDYDVQA